MKNTAPGLGLNNCQHAKERVKNKTPFLIGKKSDIKLLVYVLVSLNKTKANFPPLQFIHSKDVIKDPSTVEDDIVTSNPEDAMIGMVIDKSNKEDIVNKLIRRLKV